MKTRPPSDSGRLPANAALVIIDVQRGFDDPRWGHRNNPGAERNIGRLLEAWRSSGRPVIHVKHMSQSRGSPLREGQPGNEIKKELRPRRGEALFRKKVNSAFIGTGLERLLRRKRVQDLVITGLATDHCVSTTARMAGNLGFRTIVAADGAATFDRIGYDGKKYAADEIHQTTLASLNGEFAEVLETRAILKRV